MKKTISERLKQIMINNNLKQVDILEKAKPYCVKYNVKLGKNDLSQYVSGKVEPGQRKLWILALVLNVSEAWLMGYDVPMERNNDISSTIEKSSAENGKGLDKNTVVIVGRDGRRIEKKLSDEQIKALEMMVEQLPPFEL